MSLRCVVHYNYLKNSEIKPLTESSHQTLKDNKLARQRLGGENEHSAQCQTVPDVLDTRIHGSHRKCYQRFTKGVTIEKKRKLKESEAVHPKRARRSGEGAKQIFPPICMFCKSGDEKRISVNGSKRREKIHKIDLASEEAEKLIIKAARESNDAAMQAIVADEKLREREFQYHDTCYRNYTYNYRYANENPKSEDKTEDKFNDVVKFVKANIIELGRTCSMELLTDIYGKDPKERKERLSLKAKLEKEFNGELLFLNVTYHSAQAVMHKSCLLNNTMLEFMKENKKAAVKESARIIREEILNMIQDAPALSWPPKVDDLLDVRRQPPDLVRTFLKYVLHDSHHRESGIVEDYIWSYSQDLVHGVSRGSFLTAKHTLLANCLHSLTGQKIPIDLLSAFGNGSCYNLVQLIETAQAELVRKMKEEGFPLPIVPENTDTRVTTHFWWDNFDVKKENKSGGLHTTHGVAFQEEVQGETKKRDEGAVSVVPSGKRTVTVVPQKLESRKVVKHLSPNIQVSDDQEPEQCHTSDHREGAEQCILLWKLARNVHSKDAQSVSRFIGWVIKLYQSVSAKTVIVYLPPIRNPINEFSTVVECIIQSQKLSKSANMQYTHITVDAGAATKFYQVIWNNQNEFKKVLVHLGDLHGFMEFFGMIGKLVSGSGFEDTIYQADLCTTGSVKGILSGKHYNKTWLVNECFAEAIDRLFCDRYVNLPQPLEVQIKTMSEISSEALDLISESEELKSYAQSYAKAKQECMNGKYGKTPQFWVQYLNAVERLHILHYAINRNDFDLRLQMWEEAIQGCFSMNKVNYARYGTYYVMQLKNLDQTHQGAREELEKNGLSVCRNKLNIRQSIDGAGESTFMKDAKIAGGIKKFSSQDSTYEKWVLSRAGQAEYKSELFKLARMDKDTMEPRKCLRPTEILKSEAAVKQIMEVLQNTFVNPFSDDLDKSKLYNLASGCPITDTAAECMLSYDERGKTLMDDFKTRISGTHANDKKLFDPITKSKWVGFSSSAVKSTITVNGKIHDVTVQRDVLGVLVAASHKGNSPVDIDEALCSPCGPVSQPLATADNKKRKTNKSKLYEVVEPACQSPHEFPERTKQYLIYDMAATLRSTIVTPKTFKDLAIKLMNDIPQQYDTVYVACDTYKDTSIKGDERKSRGVSDKFVIRSPNVKVPAEFQKFLNNGDNKERLFEIIEQVWCENNHLLGDRVIFFARSNMCTKISRSECSVVEELASNHEEADTKVVYLLQHAIEMESEPENSVFVVRSSSGDVDIPVILLASDFPDDATVVLDSGRDKYRKKLLISDCDFSDLKKKALLGMHAFTGCDQISSFLRKGKVTCWKVLDKNPHLLQGFMQLGSEREPSEELLRNMEEFVCRLYGEKRVREVNHARRNIFWRTLKKKKKVIDLSLLPPCKVSLIHHLRRANYVGFLWRQASIPEMVIEPPQLHGWDDELNFTWSSEMYPKAVAEFLASTSSISCEDNDDEEDDDIEEETDDVNDVFEVESDDDDNPYI